MRLEEIVEKRKRKKSDLLELNRTWKSKEGKDGEKLTSRDTTYGIG